jgi:hypothetical protein
MAGDRRGTPAGGDARKRAVRVAARAVAAAMALAAASLAPAAARELHWRSIDVAARLEPDGSLHVVETQAMVFTGDWNGGERTFRLEAGQQVRLLGLTRIDPATGAETPLREGDLDAVDEYRWTSRTVLRWRSRLPSDPPFDQTEIDYRLELVYTGILQGGSGGEYLLDHDFAFADRAGDIGRFTVALELGPGWEALDREPDRIDAGTLTPGQGCVVRRRLRWTGAGTPSAATPPSIAPALWLGAAVLVLLIALERIVWWWRRDRAVGRFGPFPDPAALDPAWFEAHVLNDPPEVVGAAWDRAIGQAEVAAVLARLVADGKLESRVETVGWGPFSRTNLHLSRKVPVEQIDAVARPLVTALFPTGPETDTDGLRAHYRSSGFSPVSKIQTALEARVQRLRGFSGHARKPSRAPTAILTLTGLGLCVLAALTDTSGVVGLVLVGLLVVVSLPGWIGATVGQHRVGWPVGGLVSIAISLLFQAGLVAAFGASIGFPLLSLAGGMLWAAGLARTFFHLLAARETPQSMARRGELAAARAWLRRELASAAPRLQDRWFPWLVAFGLTPEVDRWFRSFGGSIAAGTMATSTSSFGSGGSVSGGGWTGGGGAFGGAGATASFAAAVTTMAAGVSSASSSGSGGGGGGGGSSGGGGGGGW